MTNDQFFGSPSPSGPPTLQPFNDPRNPHRPFDPNIETRGPHLTQPLDYWFLISPQNFTPGSFRACAGSLEATGFTNEAANLIYQISAYEGTSTDLLAVTMMNENSFVIRPKPNYNGYTGDYSTGDFMQWDVGPFALNIGYTLAAVGNGSVNFDKGLTKEGVFGMTFYDAGGKTPTTTFDGDPLQNGRMAARRLNAGGSNDRQRAVNYAGRKNGPARGQSYDTWHGLFAKFFDCYRGY